MLGTRFVIHAAARPWKPAELDELIDDAGLLRGSLGFVGPSLLDLGLALITSARKGEITLPLSAALGTARLGLPVRAVDLRPIGVSATDIDPDIWAWPLSSIEVFAAPIPAQGAQGVWSWRAPGQTRDVHEEGGAK